MGNIVQISPTKQDKNYGSVIELIQEIAFYLDTTALSETEKKHVVGQLNQFASVIKEEVTMEFAVAIANSCKEKGIKAKVEFAPED